MNHKYLKTALLLAIICCGIYGCANIADKDTSATAAVEATSTGSTDSAASETIESIPSRYNIKHNEYFLYYGYGNPSDSMYLIDETGEKKINISETVQNILKENGLDSAWKYMWDVTYYYINGILYADYCGSSTEKETGIYAIDVNNSKFVKITDNNGIDYIDYYNNKLYIGFYETDDEIDTENVYTISDDFSFKPEETEYSKVLNHTGKYEEIVKTPYCLYSEDRNSLSKKDFSLKRVFDEVGYVIVHESNYGVDEYIKIFPDGTTEEIKGLHDKDGGILYYDKDKIYFAMGEFDDIEFATDVYSLDMKVGEPVHILDLKDGEIIQVVNDKLFHTIDKDLYVFDLKEGKDEPVYHYEEKPGVAIYDRYQYQIMNGMVFTCDLKDAELKWLRVDKYGDESAAIDIGCPIFPVNAYKYGSVTTYESDAKCPVCGNQILVHTYELFQLNDEYSTHASAINKSLKEKKDDFINNFSEEELNLGSECEYHKDSPYYTFYGDESLCNANIINSRFLVIEMAYCWYGGIARPLSDNDTYVFDLSTGESLSVNNFYPGTKSELNALINEKIKEAYPQNSYLSFEGICVDSSNISYYDDHITYHFGEYNIGTYEVDVSYEELNGHAKLTRMQ